MRLAISGTHGVGKSTLFDDFVAAVPGYLAVPEPYWLLAHDGTPFADGATVADLETQLKSSCALIVETGGADVVFDRCPLDFIAYLDVVSAGEGCLGAGRKTAAPDRGGAGGARPRGV